MRTNDYICSVRNSGAKKNINKNKTPDAVSSRNQWWMRQRLNAIISGRDTVLTKDTTHVLWTEWLSCIGSDFGRYGKSIDLTRHAENTSNIPCGTDEKKKSIAPKTTRVLFDTNSSYFPRTNYNLRPEKLVVCRSKIYAYLYIYTYIYLCYGYILTYL